MKIDFTKSLVSFDGKEILNEKSQPIQIKKLILDVVGMYQSDTGEESIQAYTLGGLINEDKELKSEQIVLLRKILEKCKLPVLSKGQILKLIENK